MSQEASGTPDLAGDEPALPGDLEDVLSVDGVATFRHLPEGDQRNFIRWIGSGDSRVERRKRAAILKHALELSPLAWESRPHLPDSGRG